MKEWSNQWNPFNSAKALIWRRHFEGCVKQNFLPPVHVSIDPSNKCNLNCIWCNAYEIMQRKQTDYPPKHLIKIADFCAEWGIKAICVAGGGEPFMNPGTGDMLLRLKENGVKCAPITNGVLLNDETIDIIAQTCRWIGISMDAACSDTYMQVKGILGPVDIFDRVLGNISKLTKRIKETGSKCEVGYKFLLHPLNAHEILRAVELAKSLGVHAFQLRPVGWDNIPKTISKESLDFTSLLDVIDSQIEQAMALGNENFSVYGIRHKFQPDFQRKVNFKKCWASPICGFVFAGDGNCYLCCDMRGKKEMLLCSHYPDPHEILKYWNLEKHKRLLQDIDPNKCPRCTIGPYNEITEQVIINDRMCRDFL